MNEQTFRNMAFGEKPKPKGKDVRRIRKMLREGIPPSSIPFSHEAVDKIYSKLPLGERQKIVKKVVQQEVEVNVSEEDADRVVASMIQGPFTFSNATSGRLSSTRPNYSNPPRRS